MGEKPRESQVFFEWYKGSKSVAENVEDDGRSGRPRSHRTDENVEKVWNLVHSDRRTNIGAMA
jgi:hypothetical protein